MRLNATATQLLAATEMKSKRGGARPGAGRPTAKDGQPIGGKRRHTLTPDAALALRLLAWQRYGRPTTDEEEDAVLSDLVMERTRLDALTK